MEAQNYK